MNIEQFLDTDAHTIEQPTPTVDFVKVHGLLEKSKTNWTVSKKELFGPEGQPTDLYGIFRDDTQECFGSVKSRYTPTQNREIVEMLLEAGERMKISAERGGSLDGGRKVYYQFGLEPVQIANSQNLRYLTGLSSHDGSVGIGFGTTNITVVCQNTFYRALSEVSKVKHTANSRDRLNHIIATLQISLQSEYKMIEQLIEMSKLSIPSKLSDDAVMALFGLNNEQEKVSTRTMNTFEKVKEAIQIEQNTHGENAYALFSAVTRYTNHIRNYRTIESKRSSIMLGNSRDLVDNAFDTLYMGAKTERIEDLILA